MSFTESIPEATSGGEPSTGPSASFPYGLLQLQYITSVTHTQEPFAQKAATAAASSGGNNRGGSLRRLLNSSTATAATRTPTSPRSMLCKAPLRIKVTKHMAPTLATYRVMHGATLNIRWAVHATEAVPCCMCMHRQACMMPRHFCVG